VLSLGLLIPFGAGHAPASIAASVAALTAPATEPAKHVTLVRDGVSDTVETRSATADALLAERGIARAPEDALSVDPAAPLSEGETVVYRAAVPVTVSVDGTSQALRTPAATVGELLARQGVAFDRHDRVRPAPGTAIGTDTVVTVQHVEAWTELVRRAVPPATVKRWAFDLGGGRSHVVDAGRAGLRETAYEVRRTADRRGIIRTALVSRVIRAPRARIVAEGIGEYTALSALAQRSIEGTLRLAGAAMSMVATAYSAECGGCSGMTAIGRPAGRGIIAVDPRVIPLGTHVFIPGYGTAIAGDTGGAIHGNRIDLGFNSNAAAYQFGRRSVTVYLIR